MDVNRLTQKCRESPSEAQNMAVRAGHQEVDAEHLPQVDVPAHPRTGPREPS
jgi:hypothetical protein